VQTTEETVPCSTVTGVDISSEMLQLAMAEDPEGNYICEDFTKMDISGKGYDLIVSASALHWTDDINQTLEKYHSLCGIMAYAVLQHRQWNLCGRLFPVLISWQSSLQGAYSQFP